MRIRPAAQFALEHEARYFAHSGARAGELARLALVDANGAFTVLDRGLAPIGRGKLSLTPRAVTLHPTKDAVAVAGEDRLRVESFDGQTLFDLKHVAWSAWESGDVAYARDGEAIVAVVRTRDGAEVLLIERDIIRARRRIPLDVPCAYRLVPHPAGEQWALWANAGEEGTWTFWVTIASERIDVREVTALGHAHGPVTFHPSGHELLVVSEGSLTRRSHPALQSLGRIDGPDDESLGENVAYEGDEAAIVASADTSRLYLVDLDEGEMGEEIVVEGHEPKPFNQLFPAAESDDRTLVTDLFFFRPVFDGAIASVHGLPGATTTVALLRVPSR